ncbi:MAG: cytochrome c, partial [Candidatus Dadabacteria bacterium]|nr:cytochrome c [Candidatus Dadabacteria bacterium]NIQ16655.1 cytochrome c [Candidatus Dadabacteria bacterium]
LTPKPKNLKDKNYMGNLTDDYLFNIIKYGGTSVNKSQFMPAWGSTLSDQDINDVISYIRSL